MAEPGGGEVAEAVVGGDGQEVPARFLPKDGDEEHHPSAEQPTDCSCDAPQPRDVCIAF